MYVIIYTGFIHWLRLMYIDSLPRTIIGQFTSFIISSLNRRFLIINKKILSLIRENDEHKYHHTGN